mmetsp:Transcript_38761/g.34452  ORF Transcript_38761/g.34452 Transcript_38761/m.34452 type:complete len:122 (-) Transcript_38761:1958-2323(-)
MSVNNTNFQATSFNNSSGSNASSPPKSNSAYGPSIHDNNANNEHVPSFGSSPGVKKQVRIDDEKGDRMEPPDRKYKRIHTGTYFPRSSPEKDDYQPEITSPNSQNNLDALTKVSSQGVESI